MLEIGSSRIPNKTHATSKLDPHVGWLGGGVEGSGGDGSGGDGGNGGTGEGGFGDGGNGDGGDGDGGLGDGGLPIGLGGRRGGGGAGIEATFQTVTTPESLRA